MCCLANGIPIRVIAKIKANTIWVTAIQNPPQIIHRILKIIARHPAADSFSFISKPKGANAKIASFSFWMPNGIPIIVRQRINAPIAYITNRIMPPPRNIHNILASSLIVSF